MLNYEFDTKNLVSLIIGSAVGVWYLLKKVGVCVCGGAVDALSTAAAFGHIDY